MQVAEGFFFCSEDALLELNYNDSYQKIANEIPHLGEKTDVATLRLLLKDQGYHVKCRCVVW